MIIHCKYDELVDPKTLKEHNLNRNKHPAEQIDRLVKILKYQGWRCPIKVSKRTGMITSGHGRRMAALKMKEKVPVVYQEYIDDDQEYADIQSDNAIAAWSEMDLSGVNIDVQNLGPDFDIDLLGLKNFAIDMSEKKEKELVYMECPHCHEPFEKKQAKIIKPTMEEINGQTI